MIRVQLIVERQIFRSATIDSAFIKIETSGSKVTLRGKVSSWAEKKKAENIAWAAPGVISVDNKI